MSPDRTGGHRLVTRGPAVWLPWVLLAHVIVLTGIGLVTGRSAQHVAIDIAAVGTLTALAFWPGLSERSRSVAVAVGLMVAASVFVHLTGGSVESHFSFFVVLGLLALYDDWLPFAAAGVAVLVEHGVVGMIAPDAVFGEPRSDADAIELAVVHSIYVLAASAVYLTVWRWHQTQRLASERQLREMDELTRVAFDAAPIGMAVVDLDGTIVRANAALCELLDVADTDLVGRHATEISGADAIEEVWAMVEAWSADGRNKLDLRVQYHRSDGSTLWVQVTMALVCDDAGQPRHLLAQVDDVTAEVADADRLAHSATHDPLTDLANRSALEERLEPMVAAANRRGEVLGCLFIDLDDFKSVNDDYGHDTGDALLREAAARIRSCLRTEDFVARLGGDEFVVLASMSDGQGVDQLASRMIAVVGQGFEHAGQRMRARCSIGVALHVDVDRTRVNAIVKAADLAMYRAKAAGRGTWVRYRRGDEEMPEPSAMRRGDVEDRYREILETTSEAIVVHIDGDIVAVSATARRLFEADDDHDVVGRGVEDFLTPESAVRSAERRAMVVAGGWPEPDTMRIVTFGGTLVDVEVWSHPVVWGNRFANQVHLRPIDSPLAEIARLGVELAGPRTEAVIVTDLETRIVAWNAQATELFGWTAEEAVGRLIYDVMGGLDEANTDSVARGLEDGDGWSGVQRAPTKNGEDIDLHISTRYVRDWRSSVLGVVIVCHAVFTDPGDDGALMADLASAIDEEQLVVHYQPIVRAEDGVVVKVEALVRWQHPELGLLPPAQFIPLAERTPLMPAITGTVLEIASRQVAQWRDDLLPGLELAVNISANELADPQLQDQVKAALAASGIPAQALWLEVTETSVADDPPSARKGLEGLRELGCHTALDDFGTGFATLAQLHSFPVQALKIDRMFVAGMTDNPGDAAIVRSIISLAGEIGMTVVAEGVETEEQRQALRLLGCDQLQGYLIGLPLPAEPPPRWALRSSAEEERLAALRSCRILDTEPEPVFDRIVELAARLCRTPMACLSFIDEDRSWLKARVGIDIVELPRSWAYCDHALDSAQPLLVPDTTLDDRFSSNVFVTGELGVRAYAVVPLTLDDGYTIGVLSVLDRKPRELAPTELADLRTLADQIVSELRVRRSLVDLSTKSVVDAAHLAD